MRKPITNMELKKETKELGAFLGYEIREEPKNVKIETDKWYTLVDGYGKKEVKVIAIRKINEEIIIYYEYAKLNDKMFSFPTYITQSVSLNTFKAQLLDYGKLNSIDIIYSKN